MEMKGLRRREKPMVALLVFMLATLAEKKLFDGYLFTEIFLNPLTSLYLYVENFRKTISVS